jgi:hypothetical protein
MKLKTELLERSLLCIVENVIWNFELLLLKKSLIVILFWIKIKFTMLSEKKKITGSQHSILNPYHW